jgi:hypothetical protein
MLPLEIDSLLNLLSGLAYGCQPFVTALAEFAEVVPAFTLEWRKRSLAVHV